MSQMLRQFRIRNDFLSEITSYQADAESSRPAFWPIRGLESDVSDVIPYLPLESVERA